MKKEGSADSDKKNKSQPNAKKQTVPVEKETVGNKPDAAVSSQPVVVADKKNEESSSSTMNSLVTEAAGLLRSIKPVVKSLKLGSMDCLEGECGAFERRALLDGGATHVLRPPHSEVEFLEARDVNVELAAGEATLKQVAANGTLLMQDCPQIIVPLGRLMSLGFRVEWTQDSFLLEDPEGQRIETFVENDCPTVEVDVAMKLIQQLEAYSVEIGRRIKALEVGSSNGLDEQTWRWLLELEKLFPEVPKEIISKVVPVRRWTSSSVPWNRRMRRSISRARGVILHLYSGPNRKFWEQSFNDGSKMALCVDKLLDGRCDMMKSEVIHFLAELCESGSVDVIIGGPPCRTVSELRHRQPGPRPVRDREGLGRFGLPQLDKLEKELVLNDTLLFLRQLWFFHLAQEARREKVGFLLETPRDPETYKDKSDPNVYPSFLAWPEWSNFKALFDIYEVHLEQGAFGHKKCKPTTLGTNLRLLKCLDGIKDDRGHQDHCAPGDAEDSLKESRAWAEWAPGLKVEIVKAIKDEFGDPDSPFVPSSMGCSCKKRSFTVST